MEALLVGILTLAGISVGALIIDWRDRNQLRLDLKQAKADLTVAAEKLSATHNALTTGMQALQDQVNSHEFKLSGVGKTQAWQKPISG